MDSVKDMLLLLISSSIVSNIVLSQFMGLCPFLGVSRKDQDGGRHGNGGYLRYYAGQCGSGCDLQIYLTAVTH